MRKGRECRGKLNDWVSRSKEEKACLMVGDGCEEGRSFSFEEECAAAAHIGRTGMGEKEQARLIRGRTSQPATARVIHGTVCMFPIEASRG